MQKENLEAPTHFDWYLSYLFEVQMGITMLITCIGISVTMFIKPGHNILEAYFFALLSVKIIHSCIRDYRQCKRHKRLHEVDMFLEDNSVN